MAIRSICKSADFRYFSSTFRPSSLSRISAKWKKIKARTRQSNRKEQAICKYDARTINLYIIAKPRAYLFFWQPQASSSNYIPEVSLPLGSPRDLRLPFVRVNISLSAGRPGLLLLRDGIIRTIQKLWTLRLNLVHVPTIYS